MSEPQEREDLEQLVSSPGWLRFLAYVKDQWGAVAYGRRLKQAVLDARSRHESAETAIMRVDSANDEVNKMLSWPGERVRDLTALETRRTQEQTPMVSRRGTL